MKSGTRAFLALDAGTGGGKCVLFDAAGHRLGLHRQPWTYTGGGSPGLPFTPEFEFDTKEFWRILCHCITAAVADAGLEPRDIAGIAATSQREGCVFLNATGQEIYAGPDLDARGFTEGIEIVEQFGDHLYDITGHSPPFVFPIARYLWHRAHRSEPVARLLMINDWLVYRLSGRAASEPSNATESMLFDLRRRAWSEEILARFDIPARILPPVHPSGSPAGGLTAAAAAETGLREGTPVFLGGADTQCSLLGAGVLDPGALGAALGTTTPVQLVLDGPVFDPQRQLWAGCHVLPDRWVMEGNAGDTGNAYLWLLHLIGGERQPDRLFEFGEELARSEDAPRVFSYFGPGVSTRANARLDRPAGILFPFPSFRHRPDRGDLVRSFLDSIGFAIRASCERTAAVARTEPRSLTLSGGLSRSHALARRVANITGRPVGVAEEAESAALGCAILAAVGTAAFSTVEAAVAAMVQITEVLPDPNAAARYEPLYAKWRELAGALDALSI